MALSLSLLMKMFVVFGILLHVSQHALAGVVEVNKGAESVLLPCLYKDRIPEVNPSVIWTQNNLNPKCVHMRRDEDDLKDQNQVYKGRTSMRPDALDTRNFSLILRKPQLSDTGEYTCSIGNGIEERRVTEVQLKVKDQQVEVNVNEGAESVILPCRTSAHLPEDATVEWTRSGPEIIFVHVHTYTRNDNNTQNNLCNSRTEMNKDFLRTGDLSLTLKYPTDRDSGEYICTVYRDEDILRQKVVLKCFKEKFPASATTLLVFFFLLLLVSGGVLFYFRWYFMSVYNVEVDSGDKSVLLPCRTTISLPKDAKVEWTGHRDEKVHVFENGFDQPEKQNQFYKNRTKMNQILLKTGDLSLTLEQPTERDSGTFTCIIYSREGNILMKKQVQLEVKACQVEVRKGAESVLLPFRTSNLPEEAEVEWLDSKYRKVHVFEKNSNQPEKQNQFYRNRTKMNKNLLETGDLSLTLKHPTEEDSGTFTCTVFGSDGIILRSKEVQLRGKVSKVKVDSGDKSVLLPCRTTVSLFKDVKVEWTDHRDEKVHVFENGSDQPEKQDQFYKNRTKMNKILLKTGDLSLTLEQPTEGDSGTFTCTVFGSDENILKTKQVQLEVKGRVQVQDLSDPSDPEATPLTNWPSDG